MDQFIKKLLVVSVLLFATSAQAQWHHGGGHYYYNPGYGWVVPAVIGGAIVYGATRPANVEFAQPVYAPPPPPVQPAPVNMHWEAILDQNCNCYRTVLVPN